ncbi:monooxygenase [Pyrenophora seminiperda CCB06]|uniref:Monooxygenase n=1 Tax=Pyrenophora seminiperda CCB06 TaxID=1302712 RepID=A0A3M7MCR8_9PLEO|nr:monooxygenase [Pyrenophora seminiperda CCB06]
MLSANSCWIIYLTGVKPIMSFDTEVLIIGAGMSGLGLAVQIIRNYGIRNFELIEKSDDVGGTWLANTYPGCGCDVASHFYSYSFALNPDWTRKYSMRPEIQAYFRSVAEQYRVVDHIRFHSVLEKAVWKDLDNVWEATVLDLQTKERIVRRAKILVSSVGSLSVPKACNLPGAETYQGNGCSATQFVPIMANEPSPARKLTQFGRQAQYLAERQNPYYSNTFKAVMRYVPLAMRLYRAKFYYEMERDWSGFDIETGRNIRQDLAKENEAYVKSMAPPRCWDALIPKTEIGCKRKVLDTDYLKTLWRDNIELVANDPVEKITETGVINFTLRLLEPILKSLPSYQSRSFIRQILAPPPTTVEVKSEAAMADFRWTQSAAKKLVWASGCVNWAVDPKTGLNNMMYPDWQFMYWLRSIFWKKHDFVYRDERTGGEVRPGSGKVTIWLATAGALACGAYFGRDWIQVELPQRLGELITRG